jgi:hypothetical protein
MSQSTVLVVHGIANRDAEGFERQVASLGESVGRPDLDWVPVYWGDLGPLVVDLRCVPGREDDDLPGIQAEKTHAELVEGMPPESLPAPREPKQRVMELASELVLQQTGERPTEDVQEAIRTAVSSAATTQDTVRPEVASVLADIVADWPPSGTGTAEEGLLDPLTRVLARVARRVDQEVGEAVGNCLETVLRRAESSLDRIAAKTIGDVLAYEAEGARIRGRLDTAFKAASGQRVHVLGHSLGSLVAAEWLLGAEALCEAPTDPQDRSIDTLVTFGSQVSMFAELHGLRTAAGRRMPDDFPIAFPADLRQWINVWHQFDPLSFVMRRVISPQKPVDDLRFVLDHVPRDMEELATAHSSYWSDPRFAAELGRAL